MRTEAEASEMLGNLLILGDPDYRHLRLSNAIPLLKHPIEFVGSRGCNISLDWIIFGTCFEIALHATRGRNE